ncbi:MAG: hypothetical protein KDB22_05900 [Planctomycetales bacterium]|nr:hypothetical protein [Planctomycetales bacterium]
MTTLADGCYSGAVQLSIIEIVEPRFATLSTNGEGALTPAVSELNERKREPGLSSSVTVDRAVACSSKLRINAAVRRELREARKDISISAFIALATAVTAISFGLLSVASGAMFLVGSWMAHGLAYRSVTYSWDRHPTCRPLGKTRAKPMHETGRITGQTMTAKSLDE